MRVYVRGPVAQATVENIRVYKIDVSANLIMVEGSVPGEHCMAPRGAVRSGLVAQYCGMLFRACCAVLGPAGMLVDGVDMYCARATRWWSAVCCGGPRHVVASRTVLMCCERQALAAASSTCATH